MRPPPGLWRKCWSISKWNTRTLPWWSMKMVTWAQWYLEILLYEMVNVSLYSYVTLVLATRSCWPAWPIWRQHLRRRVQVTVPAGLHRSHTSFHQVLIQQLSFNYATDGQEAFWNWYDRAWNYLKSMPNLLWNLNLSLLRTGTDQTCRVTSCGHSWTCSSTYSATASGSVSTVSTSTRRKGQGIRGTRRSGTPASSGVMSSGRWLCLTELTPSDQHTLVTGELLLMSTL